MVRTTSGAAPPALGELLRPGDDGYDEARRIHNAAIDKRPALIARPRDARQVAAAIRYSREHGLELAVKGGGHSVPGHSVTEGGLMLDLAGCAGVSVDPIARRASVGGGALLGQLDAATQEHGLAVPTGQVSHTGVGGLTLGGGTGWLMRKHGLTIDSLVSAEVATAEGEIVTASADQNPDLFWGLRGGGGNFGVVTSFKFRLHEVGRELLAGIVVHTLDRAAEALRLARDFMDDAPDELTIFETLVTAPPDFPPEVRDRPALAILIAYAGPVDEGERVVQPLRECVRPAVDAVVPIPYVTLQQLLDRTAPHGRGNYTKSDWHWGLPDAAIETLLEHHERVTSPHSQIILGRMGGAVAAVPEEATAFSHRDANRLFWIVSRWDDDGARHVEWTQRTYEAMRPYASGGVYVNGLDDDEPRARVHECYGDEKWRRLVQVKRRWDPENVFRLNQNIPPKEER